MHHILFRAAPLAGILLLAGCNTKPTDVVAGGPADPTANQVAAAPPVKLPPALIATKSYRCKDNTLVYVDWFNDQLTANLKMKKDGDPIKLTAEVAGQPYSGEGYQLTGTATGASVTYKKPGGDGQSCDA